LTIVDTLGIDFWSTFLLLGFEKVILLFLILYRCRNVISGDIAT